MQGRGVGHGGVKMETMYLNNNFKKLVWQPTQKFEELVFLFLGILLTTKVSPAEPFVLRLLRAIT